MAMMDYGSVVKKNGKIIQKEAFMNMKKAVGFRIKEITLSYKEHINTDDINYKPHTPKHYDYKAEIDGNYFSYMGDEDLLLCIYKCGIMFISHGKIIKYINNLEEDYNLPYYPMVLNFNFKGINFHIKRLSQESNRYELRFWYKGNLYECLYGYGVDVNKNMWYYDSKKEKRYVMNWFKEK